MDYNISAKYHTIKQRVKQNNENMLITLNFVLLPGILNKCARYMSFSFEVFVYVSANNTDIIL